jgi:hypothetical protein
MFSSGNIYFLSLFSSIVSLKIRNIFMFKLYHTQKYKITQPGFEPILINEIRLFVSIAAKGFTLF